MDMRIERIDHLVLTVESIEETCRFYSEVLGMAVVEFGDGRKALSFGLSKINLHERGKEFLPKARVPAPGSADFCLVCSVPLSEVAAHFDRAGVKIEEGPVARTGAIGAISSLYVRDPDGNLVEVSEYE